MELIKSENNQFIDAMDVFLYTTTFVSIKTIYSLRASCKKINRWLSDPTTFSWKLRVQKMFPHSYEDILKQAIDDQIRRLLKFDSFVEEGHSVSCYNLVMPPLPLQTNFCYQFGIKQLPWQKNICVFLRHCQAWLLDANTAAIGQILDLGKTFTTGVQVLFNINERKIGFLMDTELKLYRNEGIEFVPERETVINRNREAMPQIYGDCLVFRNMTGDNYQFHSISTNSIVFELNLDGYNFFEELSEFTPLAYLLYKNNNEYLINEVNLLTRQTKEYSLAKELKEGSEVIGMTLIESVREKYLKILVSGCGLEVQIYDLVHQRLVFSRFYSDMVHRNISIWSGMKYSPDLRYYGSNDIDNGEVSIKEFKETIASHDNAVEIFSKKFKQSRVIVNVQWLTNDIVRMCTLSNEATHTFFSARKRQVIGFLYGDLTLFSYGSKAIAFDLGKAVAYSITFATIDHEDANLKRKLEDPDEESDRKKQKLSNTELTL